MCGGGASAFFSGARVTPTWSRPRPLTALGADAQQVYTILKSEGALFPLSWRRGAGWPGLRWTPRCWTRHDRAGDQRQLGRAPGPLGTGQPPPERPAPALQQPGSAAGRTAGRSERALGRCAAGVPARTPGGAAACQRAAGAVRPACVPALPLPQGSAPRRRQLLLLAGGRWCIVSG